MRNQKLQGIAYDKRYTSKAKKRKRKEKKKKQKTTTDGKTEKPDILSVKITNYKAQAEA